MDLQENLQQVEANICKACENAGRKRSDVTLIAVSKTKPIEMLQTVYDLGPRDFGENKVQEMCEKMEVLPKDIRWHMIGHLQRNKVKYIVDKVALLQKRRVNLVFIRKKPFPLSVRLPLCRISKSLG